MVVAIALRKSSPASYRISLCLCALHSWPASSSFIRLQHSPNCINLFFRTAPCPSYTVIAVQLPSPRGAPSPAAMPFPSFASVFTPSSPNTDRAQCKQPKPANCTRVASSVREHTTNLTHVERHAALIPPHTLGVQAAISASLSHRFLYSLDVVKCNMQTNPSKYKRTMATYHHLTIERGRSVLSRGILPTFIGYSIHGYLRYSLYERFRRQYASVVGKEYADKHPKLIRCVSVASAEFIAVVPLSPMAMVKLKMQTAPPGTWPTTFVHAVLKMITNRAHTGFPFGNIVPLWLRQVPSATVQICCFDELRCRLRSYALVHTTQWNPHDVELGVTLLSAYCVAVLSTVVSQPADYMLSRLSMAENRGRSLRSIAVEDGLWNVMTRGLAPRYVRVGAVTGLQFLLLEMLLQARQLGH